MYFGCVCFRGELGFLNCDDICVCVVNKQFELLEFVFDSVYVDLQYDEISLTFTAGSVSMCCCCCMPSETYGRNGATPIFRSFHRTASSTTVLYIILSTMVSFWTLIRMPYYFTMSPFFVCTFQ